MTVALIQDPGFLPFFVGGFLMRSGLQLRQSMWYPLARRRRAALAVAGTWIELVVFFTLTGVFTALFMQLPLPALPFGAETTTSMDWVLGFGCALALAPIAQWGAIHWPDDGSRAGAAGSRRDFAHFMRLLAYLLATGFVNVTIRASSRVAGQLDRAVVGVLLVLLVVQVVHVWRLWRRSVHGDIGGSVPA